MLALTRSSLCQIIFTVFFISMDQKTSAQATKPRTTAAGSPNRQTRCCPMDYHASSAGSKVASLTTSAQSTPLSNGNPAITTKLSSPQLNWMQPETTSSKTPPDGTKLNPLNSFFSLHSPARFIAPLLTHRRQVGTSAPPRPRRSRRMINERRTPNHVGSPYFTFTSVHHAFHVHAA
jgi:hypothetical protein